MVGIDWPKSSSVPGPDVDAAGAADSASDCPAVSTFSGGDTRSEIPMLASGMTTPTQIVSATTAAARASDERLTTVPGHPAVPPGGLAHGAS